MSNTNTAPHATVEAHNLRPLDDARVTPFGEFRTVADVKPVTMDLPGDGRCVVVRFDDGSTACTHRTTVWEVR